MTYISQENKASKMPAIKAILKEYNLKGSVSVDNHSSLVLTIKSGPIDFLSEDSFHPNCFRQSEQPQVRQTYLQVNTYWIADHFRGKAAKALLALKAAMMVGNHDNSDISTDYFDVGWYVNINIGRWDRPYILIK